MVDAWRALPVHERYHPPVVPIILPRNVQTSWYTSTHCTEMCWYTAVAEQITTLVKLLVVEAAPTRKCWQSGVCVAMTLGSGILTVIYARCTSLKFYWGTHPN